jgi:hypothetical protein
MPYTTNKLKRRRSGDLIRVAPILSADHPDGGHNHFNDTDDK